MIAKCSAMFVKTHRNRVDSASFAVESDNRISNSSTRPTGR